MADKKLNIAFYCREFPVYSETFIYKKAQNLIECGHNVHVYCKFYNKEKIKSKVWKNRVHVLPDKYNIAKVIYYSWVIFFNLNIESRISD